MEGSSELDDDVEYAPDADEEIDEEVPYLPWIEEEREPDWTREVPTSGLELDWDARGGDWLKELSEVAGGCSMSRRGGSRKRPGLVLSPSNNARQSTCLWVQGTNSGFRAAVWGTGTVDDRVVADWSDAVQEAYRRLVGQPEGDWFAAIRSVDDYQLMAEPGEVGGLSLVSAEEPFVERVKRPDSLGTAVIHWSHPVIVEGGDLGVRGFDVGGRPGARLKILCSLLTVAWDSAWVLMDGPQPGRYRGELATRSEYDAPINHVAETEPTPTDVWLPPWLSEAMGRTNRDSALKHALLMYHESVMLEEQHPSVSLVCLTSATEALAARRAPKPERCVTCGQVTGSTARFRSILAEVLPDDKAKEVAAAYAYRSKTVHEAEMHADGGFWQLLSDFHLPENSSDFREVQWRLSRACRELLLRELSV